MTVQKSRGSVRKYATRVLAIGALLFLYAFGMIATAGMSPAFAQRGRGRGWGRGGGNIGAAVGIGIGAAIVGGAIAAQQAQQQDAVGYCMRRFRSYDPESMTYLGRDGRRYSCP